MLVLLAGNGIAVRNLLNGLIRFNVPTVKVTGCVPE
jgi:hypothetical protein